MCGITGWANLDSHSPPPAGARELLHACVIGRLQIQLEGTARESLTGRPHEVAGHAVQPAGVTGGRRVAVHVRVDPHQAERALQRARYAAWRARVDATQAIEEAKPLGVKPDAITNGSQSACIAIDTPFDVAVKMASTSGMPEPR